MPSLLYCRSQAGPQRSETDEHDTDTQQITPTGRSRLWRGSIPISRARAVGRGGQLRRPGPGRKDPAAARGAIGAGSSGRGRACFETRQIVVTVRLGADSNWKRDLKNDRRNDLAERRTAAADAKAALLDAYRAAKEAAEPTRLTREAERQAVAAAREERRAARERMKTEEAERVQAEAAEREAAIAAAASAEMDARRAADKARVSRVIEDEAARKAERDRRYANRKARQE